MKEFGLRMKEARRNKGMTQRELAEAIGAKHNSISNWENGQNHPNMNTIERICNALEITPAYLMGWNRPIDELDMKVLELYPDFRPGEGHLPTIESSDIITHKKANSKPKYPPNALPAETNFVNIPILGSVSAGLGCLADNEIVGYEPWGASSIKRGHKYIVLKVSGDSMYPSLIEDDLVLIQCQTTIDSGRIAVVTVNGDEGVIKKVKYGSDWIELHSVNPMYPVRRFEGEDVQLINVMGLVVESKRKF